MAYVPVRAQPHVDLLFWWDCPGGWVRRRSVASGWVVREVSVTDKIKYKELETGSGLQGRPESML